ncbi:acyltransferase [Luminiphilus sp.]|nr:acyltransferase [Luminiphilus sp.]
MTSVYLPHIDGLRGIAVLAILLFHLNIPGAHGGFLGVDIFFVISGFLITGQISRLAINQEFSLSNFYLRRGRRLLPALFATLLVSMIIGFYVLSPHDLILLAKSVLASQFFYSNLYFWSTAGYFSDISQSNILLHTWSLAVEEQFYLVWPLLLLALIKGLTSGGRSWALLTLLTASVIGSVWAAKAAPDAAFYLLPFRFHEFLMGGLAYQLGATQQRRLNAIGSGKLAAVGSLLIVGSFFVIDDNTTFPGLMSLPPTIGIALLLLSSPPRLLSRFLTWMPLKQIGLASYSIYLIHWPLIAFSQRTSNEPDGSITRLVIFVSAITLGYASYRLIEGPFRNPTNTIYHPKVFMLTMLLSLAGLTTGVAMTLSHDGYPDRFPGALQMNQEDLYQERERYWSEFGLSDESKLQINDDPEYVLVIGNSHAQDLVFALRQNAFPGDLRTIITPFKCFNFGVGTLPSDDAMCNRRRGSLLNSPLLKDAKKIYLHEDFNGEWIIDLFDFLKSLRSTTDAPIYLLGPRLTFKKSVLQIAHEHKSLEGLNEYALTQSFFPERKQLSQKLQNAFNEATLSALGIYYVDTLEAQCGGSFHQCDIVSSKTSELLYFDNSHFTTQGAKEFGAALKLRRPDLFQLQ